MAQIYKRKVKTVREPSVPDTGLMTAFEKKRAGAVEAIGKTAETIEKRLQKQEESIFDLLEAKALQIYKNGYDLYNNNVDEYNKFTTEELQKLYESVPDSDAKNKVMAKVAIAGSGYDAKVTRRHWDQQEKVANMRFKDATFTAIDSATEGLGSLFAASDNNLTDEQKREQMQAFLDAQIPLYTAYENRLATDSNKNPIFSAAEKKVIEDRWENRGSYALLDYAGENIQTNREGVVALRQRLVENKNEFQEQLGIDDKAYAKTLSDLDKIISGQTTAHDLKNAEIAKIVNSATVKDMEIGIDGDVGNKKYNNIDTTVGIYRQLEQAEREGAYTSRADREKLAAEKGKVARAVIKQIEDEVGLKYRKGKRHRALEITTLGMYKYRPNIGETAVAEVNKNLGKLETSLLYQDLTDDEKAQVKANMYIDVLGGLREAEGIELRDSSSPKGTELAKRVATGSYYKQIESLVGYKVVAEDPNDPASVKIAYDNALLQYDNKTALDAIRNRLQLKARP